MLQVLELRMASVNRAATPVACVFVGWLAVAARIFPPLLCFAAFARSETRSERLFAIVHLPFMHRCLIVRVTIYCSLIIVFIGLFGCFCNYASVWQKATLRKP
jgi:hypothetical protein